MNKAVIYTRVSTPKQVTNYSLGIQREEGEKYCKNHNLQIIEVIQDVCTGTHFDRPGIKRIVELIDKYPEGFFIVVEHYECRTEQDCIYRRAIESKCVIVVTSKLENEFKNKLISLARKL